MMTESRRFTVVILGDSWVGKTSLLEQFINKEYNEFQPIIFFNLFETKTIINDDEIDLFLWDTPGLDRFSRAVRSYSKRADGVVLVYDVTRFDTFTELTRRLSHFRAENKTAPAIIDI
ncbi:unnamed protein product [Larinioides sclopetarius]|uniref:GTP-binding protein n=1 Tax=Larinioides sclopetarius TaxID=280406 RepID=A0AAV2AC14_9ARAC